MNHTNCYRSDIDGLRAVAVLAVLLYHLGTPGFAGGFVGVDVFFVISGFLITRLIRNEVLITGRMRFGAFYIRRARRLFPAMVVTLLGTGFIGACLLPPDLLRDLAASTIAAIASVSNIWFWNQSGYFDTSVLAKPLLHTWSLAVEEQFYLLWPVLLVFLMRTGRQGLAFAVLASLALVSFAWSVDLVANDGTITRAVFPSLGLWFADARSTAFYLLPFRIFELAIGAMLVRLIRYRPSARFVLDACVVVGLALIAYPVLAYTEATIFPSYNALLPCIGAALLIYAGNASVLSRVYDNAPCVALGKISYSLYLIHWPAIVFYLYWRDIPSLGASDMIILGAGSIAAAAAMYFLVEQPFRRPTDQHRWTRFAGVAATAAAFLGITSYTAYADGGWRWRYSEDVLALVPTSQADLGMKSLPYYDCFMGPKLTYKDIPAKCYEIDQASEQKSIALFGDSTAHHLISGLMTALGDRYDIYEFASASCAPVRGHSEPDNLKNCQLNNEAFLTDIIRRNRYDLVLISNNLRWESIKNGLPDAVKILDAERIPYALLGQVPFFKRGKPADLVLRNGDVASLDEAVQGRLVYPCNSDEHGLDALVPPGRFFSMKKMLCQGSVPVYQVGGKLIHLDHIHFNQYGSLWAARNLVDWLRSNDLVDD